MLFFSVLKNIFGFYFEMLLFRIDDIDAIAVLN